MWCGGHVKAGIFAVLKKKRSMRNVLHELGSSSSQAVQGSTHADTSSNIFHKTTRVMCFSAEWTH
jgi:hypothetical protein